MLKMSKRFLNVLKTSKKGQGMVEYGLIIGLVSVVAIGALALLGPQIKGFFDSIVTTLSGK